ncbi:MAG TPA: c-type cytochrome domain-containing protein [Polyangiaceae bacterium]|nr:c-type cytochrome domain-containing protein [Polyangiaceae bacterium]
MKSPTRATFLVLLAGAISSIQCSGGDDGGNLPPPPSCVENLNIDCKELRFDPPVYSKIFTGIIQPQCTLGSSCHGIDGAMGGIVLANADDTYDTLLGLKGGPKRVLPNDPKCSPFMVRLESRDPNYQMPRGSRLTEPELCDFVQWIKQGASKN